jgi:hypothetical protein
MSLQKTLLSLSIAGTALLTSLTVDAVTIRLSPSTQDELIIGTASTENFEKENAVVKRGDRSQNYDPYEPPALVDTLKSNKMQGEINELTDALRAERNVNDRLGRGSINEIYLGDWYLDSTKTLMQNMMNWVQQAKIETGKDIKLLWEAPGPGDFKVSYHFNGTWSEAFMSLGHAIEKTPEWPVRIDVNTRMNVVKVSAIQH